MKFLQFLNNKMKPVFYNINRFRMKLQKVSEDQETC